MPKIILVFLILIFLESFVLSTPCTDVSNPSSYRDCQQFRNETEETICCFVLKDSSGNENQKNTCCFDMDLIFDGKVMTFKNNVISGTLNCNSDENSSQSLIPNQVVMLLYILIIFFM